MSYGLENSASGLYPTLYYCSIDFLNKGSNHHVTSFQSTPGRYQFSLPESQYCLRFASFAALRLRVSDGGYSELASSDWITLDMAIRPAARMTWKQRVDHCIVLFMTCLKALLTPCNEASSSSIMAKISDVCSSVSQPLNVSVLEGSWLAISSAVKPKMKHF